MVNADILSINTALKFIEFIIGSVDRAEDAKTVGQIRHEFKDRFKHDMQPILNQNFGIIRLIPLMLIRETRVLDNTDYGKKVKCIRNAFAHGSFSYDESGYTFFENKDQKRGLHIGYDEFVKFIWEIENNFLRRTV